MTPRRVGLILAVWLAGAVPTLGQPARSWPGRVEVSGGVLWSAREPLGGRPANLTTNEIAPATPLRWFTTTSELGAASGIGVRLGWWLGSHVSVEGALEAARLRLRTRVADDVEAAGVDVASLRLTEYALSAGAVVDLTALAFARGRGRPFARATVGVLRQLDPDRHVVGRGRLYHIGGGVQYAVRVRSNGRLRGVGLRVDAALKVRDGGVRVDGRRRATAAAMGGLFVRF